MIAKSPVTATIAFCDKWILRATLRTVLVSGALIFVGYTALLALGLEASTYNDSTALDSVSMSSFSSRPDWNDAFLCE